MTLREVGGVVRRVPFVNALDHYTSADASNYSFSVNRAVQTLATAATGGEVILPNRAEAYATTIAPVSGITLRGGGSGTELVQSAAVDLIKPTPGAISTRTSLTADAPVGATTVTLPTGAGAGFSAGSYLELRSTAVIYATNQQARDVRKVIAVAGDVLTLDGALLHSFNVADSATFALVTPLTGLAVRDLLITNPDPGTNKGYGLRFDVVADLRLAAVTLRDAGGAIQLRDVIGGHVSQLNVDRLQNGSTLNPGDPAYGYGVVLSGACAGVTVDHSFFRGVRHATTTLTWNDGAGLWGGPRDCLFDGLICTQAPDGLSHFDTHEGGINITYANCLADGGGATGNAGYQMRAQAGRLVNCRALRVGGRAVSIQGGASDWTIDGGEFAYCDPTGLVEAVALSGDRATLRGADVHHNGRNGVNLGLGVIDPLVQGCRIHHNGQAVLGRGIQDQGAVNPVLKDNLIPFDTSTSQKTAVLNLSATGLAQGNICLGYSQDSEVFFTPNAAAQFRDNVTSNGGVRIVSNADFPMGPYDRTVLVTTGATGRTVTLPSAAAMKGERVQVVKEDSGAGTVTVAGTINGATNYTIPATQWASVTLVSNGTNWRIVGKV